MFKWLRPWVYPNCMGKGAGRDPIGQVKPWPGLTKEVLHQNPGVSFWCFFSFCRNDGSTRFFWGVVSGFFVWWNPREKSSFWTLQKAVNRWRTNFMTFPTLFQFQGEGTACRLLFATKMTKLGNSDTVYVRLQMIDSSTAARRKSTISNSQLVKILN